MATGKTKAINHTSFTVADLDRTALFFSEALGLEVMHLTPASQAVMEGVTGVDGAIVRVAYVQCPGHQIELFEYLGPADRQGLSARPCDVGSAHVAFEVEDMGVVLEQGARHGFEAVRTPIIVDLTTLRPVAEGEPPQGPALLNCYVRDGDGLTIELMQYL